MFMTGIALLAVLAFLAALACFFMFRRWPRHDNSGAGALSYGVFRSEFSTKRSKLHMRINFSRGMMWTPFGH